MKERCWDWMHQGELPCLLALCVPPRPVHPSGSWGGWGGHAVRPAAAAGSWLSPDASCAWTHTRANGSHATPHLTVSAVGLDPLVVLL